jgi:hypothetical protein
MTHIAYASEVVGPLSEINVRPIASFPEHKSTLLPSIESLIVFNQSLLRVSRFYYFLSMFNRRSFCLLALAIAPLAQAAYVTVEGDCETSTPTPTPYASYKTVYTTTSTTETDCDCTDMTPTLAPVASAPATPPAAVSVLPPAAASVPAVSTPVPIFVPYPKNNTTPYASSPALATQPPRNGASSNLVNMGGAIVVLAITGFALM